MSMDVVKRHYMEGLAHQALADTALKDATSMSQHVEALYHAGMANANFTAALVVAQNPEVRDV